MVSSIARAQQGLAVDLEREGARRGAGVVARGHDDRALRLLDPGRRGRRGGGLRRLVGEGRALIAREDGEREGEDRACGEPGKHLVTLRSPGASVKRGRGVNTQASPSPRP